jgi:hypothetical protein
MVFTAVFALALAVGGAETATASAPAEVGRVTGVRAVCRNGQTFVTWKDVAEGAAGQDVRYALYRSEKPITQTNLDQAELCYKGVVNNSAKLFGAAFFQKDRQNPNTPVSSIWEDGKLVRKPMPTFILEEGGPPLPMWSGLAVHTATKDGPAYYAVVPTDLKGEPLGQVEPGQSATTEPVAEKVAPIQPIKFGDGKVRGQWAGSSSVTGKQGLPLMLSLHGSQSTGGGAGDHGDMWVYFGTPEMGWRDGLPGVFTVVESRGAAAALSLAPRDCIEDPSGNGVIETCWFGYFCIPVGAKVKEFRAYAFTERRLMWMVKWAIERYGADPNRVYSSGQSMGGMGSTQFSYRHPEVFAAVYPRLGRVRQTWLPTVGMPTIQQARWNKPAPMEDGATDYFVRQDSVKWVSEHHEDLPFYGWCSGRTDWVEPFKSQIEMVKALTAGHHPFAFSWNNGGHDTIGAAAMNEIMRYYPPAKFARNRSLPAFGNSSINGNLGSGELGENKQLKDGDLVGGINLGFDWTDVVDEPGRWSAKLSNSLAKEDMTVDVTPRRCQAFKPKPGETFRWTTSAGGQGQVAADPHGLVTVAAVKIKPGEATVLTIER